MFSCPVLKSFLLTDRRGTCCGLKLFWHVMHSQMLVCIALLLCGYFGFCHLPVTLNQSGHFPLTTLNNKSCQHSLQRLETVVHEIPRISTLSEILKPPHLKQKKTSIMVQQAEAGKSQQNGGFNLSIVDFVIKL